MLKSRERPGAGFSQSQGRFFPLEATVLEMSSGQLDQDQARKRDLALARRAGRGDREAFHEIVDRHAQALFALAVTLSGNHADAEDAVQETFTAALTRIGRFRGQATLKTWLTRILVNQIAMARRRGRVRRALPLDGQTEAPGRGHGKKPNEAADARMDLPTLLGALNEGQRQVLVLREIEGLSYQEIAELLEIPRGTVESRLFRARRALRERFGDFLT